MAHADHAPTLALIVQLCLEAGRVMEDTSAELATVLPAGVTQVHLRLKLLNRASEDIAAFSAAADALLRQYVAADMVE